MSTENSQLTIIQRGVRLLFKPGQLIEFRVKRADESWRGFYYDNHKELAQSVLRLDSDPRVVSLYYVINAVRPNLPKQRGITVNPDAAQVDILLDGPTQQLTSNDDVETFNWLFIDVDTTRVPHLLETDKKEFDRIQHEPSTKEEKASAEVIAKSVAEFLVEEKKWPQPLLGDSGNGFHILAKVNLLNSAHNKNILIDCLKALAAKFDAPAAGIDASVFNPARLTRAYGTTTRKGTNTEERPYRQNKLFEPRTTIGEVSLEQMLNLATEISAGRRKDDERPETVEEFEPLDWIEHYAEQGAWTVEGTRDTGGMQIVVTDQCPVAGHKHTGSGLTGFIIGDTFGFHCFSDDCEGSTIGTIFKLLKEATNDDGKPKYVPYDKPIFKNEVKENFQEMLKEGDIVVASDEDDKVDQVEESRLDAAMAPVVELAPEQNAKNDWKTASEGIDGLDIRCNDQATYMLGIMLHHPEEVWQDGFLLFMKRFKDKLGYDAKGRKIPKGEVSTATLQIGVYETLRMIIKYAETHKRLPDRGMLRHFLDVNTDLSVRKTDYKKDILLFIDGVPDYPANTFDETAISLIKNLDFRQEVRAWREAFSYHLLSQENIQDARDALKKHFNLSTTQDTNFEQGPWQERVDAVYDDFERNILGVGDSRKFVLGLPSIDNSGMNIGLDGDRAICFCGPASNRKTTLALSVTLNFGINGKNVLFFAGEHLPRKLLKKLTLQLSHFFKDESSPLYDAEIASIPGLSKWEGLNRSATKDDLAKIKKLLLRLKAENLVPGYIEPQSIDAVARGSEDKVQALLDHTEATYAKYQWDAIIIDPLDTIMPPEVAGAKGVGNWKLCSGVVDRLFDFSRNAFGGKGCMVIVTAQFGADARRDIERIQDKNGGADNYDDELTSILRRDGLIQYFTTIGQRFDLCLGVATRTKDGVDGLLVKGRDREGGTFDNLRFVIDKDTNYLTEGRREYTISDQKPETILAGGFDDEL